MTPQTTMITAESLVPEIEQTLLDSREDRARHEHDVGHATLAPPDLGPHEHAVMLDVTLALLIRHRLPIDADRAAKAVADARSPDARAWAAGCAEHIALIAQEKSR